MRTYTDAQHAALDTIDAHHPGERIVLTPYSDRVEVLTEAVAYEVYVDGTTVDYAA
jgi:hypothetical protein